MNNVLVTGASGLIGGILNTKLTEHNLFGVDIKKCDYENFEISNISNSKKLETIMSKNKIDTVVHLAGNASVSANWDNRFYAPWQCSQYFPIPCCYDVPVPRRH